MRGGIITRGKSLSSESGRGFKGASNLVIVLDVMGLGLLFFVYLGEEGCPESCFVSWI